MVLTSDRFSKNPDGIFDLCESQNSVFIGVKDHEELLEVKHLLGGQVPGRGLLEPIRSTVTRQWRGPASNINQYCVAFNV